MPDPYGYDDYGYAGEPHAITEPGLNYFIRKNLQPVCGLCTKVFKPGSSKADAENAVKTHLMERHGGL